MTTILEFQLITYLMKALLPCFFTTS